MTLLYCYVMLVFTLKMFSPHLFHKIDLACNANVIIILCSLMGGGEGFGLVWFGLVSYMLIHKTFVVEV